MDDKAGNGRETRCVQALDLSMVNRIREAVHTIEFREEALKRFCQLEFVVG